MSRRQDIWRGYEQALLRKHRDLERRYQKIFKADASDEDDDDDTDNGEQHLIDRLADLLVEAGSPDGEVSRESALQWLLHSRNGQAFVSRMAAARKRANTRKDSPMNRTEHLRAVVSKAGGLDSLCKRFVAKGSSGDVSEAELVGMLTQAARQQFPDMDDARAFSKLVCGPNGELARRAIEVAKITQFSRSAYPWPQR
jgi:hypothetical protein